jgi:hypothetical protein
MPKKRFDKTPRRRIWSDQEKEQLIREVAQVHQDGKKIKTFLTDEKKVSDGWFYQMRRRYLEEHPHFDPNKPSVALAVRLEPVNYVRPKKSPGAYTTLEGPELLELVNEYMQLNSDWQGKGAKASKGDWLKQHGLNHQQIHEMKIRAGVISRRQSRELKSRKLAHPFTAPPVNGGATFIPQPLHPPVPVTLDDAILAMEVKRDQLTNFIDDLRRMQRGVR